MVRTAHPTGFRVVSRKEMDTGYKHAGMKGIQSVGWALPTEMQPIFTVKAANARPTDLSISKLPARQPISFVGCAVRTKMKTPMVDDSWCAQRTLRANN